MLKACEGQKKVGSVKANCDTEIIVESHFIFIQLHNNYDVFLLYLFSFSSPNCIRQLLLCEWVFTRACVEVHTGQ